MFFLLVSTGWTIKYLNLESQNDFVIPILSVLQIFEIIISQLGFLVEDDKDYYHGYHEGFG
jgi:hypothetical protein